jgi:hypothetical protein
MVSKIGEVLEIELMESYVKRPTGPMIMMEIQDINRLAGHIHILSMAESTTPKDTILQKICIQVCLISAGNVVNLVTSPVLVLFPKCQSGIKTLLRLCSQTRMREWREVLIPCLLTKPFLPSKCWEES